MATTGEEGWDRGENRGSSAGGYRSSFGISGLAFIGAAILFVIDFWLDNFVVQTAAYEGPAGLLSVVTNPLWIPYRVVKVAGPLVLAVGITYLLVAFYRRGQLALSGLAGTALAISIGSYVLEFVVAALAAPSLFFRPRGTGLSQGDVQLLLMGYQSIGIGLLAVAALTLGLVVVLLSIGLYLTNLSHPALAIGGVVAGGVIMLAGVGRLVPLNLGMVLGLVLFGFVILWLLALGGSLLRSPRLAA